MEVLGTEDPDFLNGLLGQLANTSLKGGQVDEQEINFKLSVIKGINPRDQVEAMLAAQMANVHSAMMMLARRLAGTETIEQQDSAERALNKLARTFAIQMETLKRYRSGGEQKITVQHVSVNEGGKAIVGNVTHTARDGKLESSANLSTALTDTRTPPMRTVGEPVLAPTPKRRRGTT
jgi:hypothetical protein